MPTPTDIQAQEQLLKLALPITISKASEITGLSAKEIKEIAKQELGGSKPAKMIFIEPWKLRDWLMKNPFRSKKEIQELIDKA